MRRREHLARVGFLIVPTYLHDLRKAGRQNRSSTFGKVLASWVVRPSFVTLWLSLTSTGCSHYTTTMIRLADVMGMQVRQHPVADSPQALS